jgi:hypothetical protein
MFLLDTHENVFFSWRQDQEKNLEKFWEWRKKQEFSPEDQIVYSNNF